MSRADQSRADRRVQTACLLILTFIASGFALWALRPVLVPVVLALFFTYWLTPIIDVQVRRLGIHRWVAVAITAMLALALLFGIGAIVGTSIASVSQRANLMAQRAPATTQPDPTVVMRVATWASATRLGHWLGLHPDSELLKLPTETAQELVQIVVRETTVIISNGTLVVVFVLFLLVGRGVKSPPRARLLIEIESRVKRYLVVIVSMSVLTGLLVGASLSILGVQFAAVFGLLALLLNFIPTLGGIIATLLPIPVVMLSPEMSVTARILAIAIPGGIQALLGAVQPKIQGDALEIHPVAVVVAVVFFTYIWGVAGAFVATPLIAVIKIILERLPATRSVAALLAGDLSMLSLFTRSAPSPRGTMAERPEPQSLVHSTPED
jgi:AI-2 transport protein TqsA